MRPSRGCRPRQARRSDRLRTARRRESPFGRTLRSLRRGPGFPVSCTTSMPRSRATRPARHARMRRRGRAIRDDTDASNHHETQMEQELDVPPCRGIGDGVPQPSSILPRALGANLVQDAGANVLVADDAARSGATRLELWFDERDDVSARAAAPAGRPGESGAREMNDTSIQTISTGPGRSTASSGER